MSKMYMMPIRNPYSDLLYSPKKYISLIKYVIKECLGKDMSSVGNIFVKHFLRDASKHSVLSKYEIREIITNVAYMRLPYRDIGVYLRTEEFSDYNVGFGILITKPEYTSHRIVYKLEVLFLGDKEFDADQGCIYREIGS